MLRLNINKIVAVSFVIPFVKIFDAFAFSFDYLAKNAAFDGIEDEEN